MNDDRRLERTATDLLDAAAPSRAPAGLLADTLASVGRTRQRARWLAYLKEPPMRTPNGVAVGSPTFRLVSVALLTLALVLGLTAAAVGAASLLLKTAEVPPPFGLAKNGLVAYANDGDIYTVDPETGSRRAIVTGPEVDVEPRWSLDGTRLLFLRTTGELFKVGIVDPNHPEELVLTQAYEADPDAVGWSPDGRSIIVGSLIVDAATGEARPLDCNVSDYVGWRPPDGRQVMALAGSDTDPVLYLLTLEDCSREQVLDLGSAPFRLSGWTPDGRHFVYQRGDWPQVSIETHVLEVATGDDVVIDAGYGHVSNDGTRMVAQAQDGMCVVDLRGGECLPVGQPHQAYAETHAEGVHWSPDDQWLLTRGDGSTAYLVDPDGEEIDQPSWLSDGGESWQRLAP